MSFLCNTRKCKVLSVQPIKSHSSLVDNHWYTLVSVQLLEVLAHAICATQTTDLLVLSKCKNWWENRSDYSRPRPISFRPTNSSSWAPTAWQKVLNSGHDSDNIVFTVRRTSPIYPFSVDGTREGRIAPSIQRCNTAITEGLTRDSQQLYGDH